MASEHVKEFTDGNWNEEVLASTEPVLVDFWAPWCGPCKAIASDVEKAAEQYRGRVKVGKVNLDENRELPTKYQIRSIPTLMVFKNGAPVDQVVGLVNKSKLEEMIEKAL